jgi:deazaflavin-dependent oxidoreductase (nitroreductase family)
MTARATGLHAAMIQRSGGRLKRSFLFAGGMPVLVLTTTGRRSGRPRATPLAYLREGQGFAVLAANAGSDNDPAWWLNLQASPGGAVEVDGERRSVRARRAAQEDEARLWSRFAEVNPAFDEYRKLTARSIPVVLLEPQEPSAL